MSFCMNCGQQLPKGAKFCSNCGTAMGDVKTEATQHQQELTEKIVKCPSCGENIPSFTAICPSCGSELRTTKVSSTIHEFVAKLEQIEANREKKETGLLKGNVNELTKTDEQKINIIRNFAIPNTKEDIYEFMILASSNINTKLWLEGDVSTVAQQAESSAWLAKFEQAYQKAELMFGKDPTFENFRKLYKNKTDALKKKKWEMPLMFIGVFLVLIIMLIIMTN